MSRRASPIAIAWTSRHRRPRGLSDARIRRAAELALEHGGRAGEGLSIVFVDDPELAAMHAEWLADSTPTDVISFDLGGGDGGPMGELYVSTERARAVAERRGLDLVREHLLYVVHGALHLCGHDDHEPRERARMRRAERTVLAQLAAPRRK
ncbi:MAG: rRNA maturation RNase YbeY [Planctomycetota bacterium]